MLRKKLYYFLRLVGGTPSEYPLVPGGGPGGMTPIVINAAGGGGIIRFVGGTGPNDSIGGANQFAGSDADRYGGVMDPNLFNGVSAANDGSGRQRARQAVKAKFQCSSANATFLAASPSICVDFVAPTTTALTAVVLAGLPSVDPATVRRPWLRVRALGAAFPAGATVDGLSYVDHQHSLEV